MESCPLDPQGLLDLWTRAPNTRLSNAVMFPDPRPHQSPKALMRDLALRRTAALHSAFGSHSGWPMCGPQRSAGLWPEPWPQVTPRGTGPWLRVSSGLWTAGLRQAVPARTKVLESPGDPAGRPGLRRRPFSSGTKELLPGGQRRSRMLPLMPNLDAALRALLHTGPDWARIIPLGPDSPPDPRHGPAFSLGLEAETEGRPANGTQDWSQTKAPRTQKRSRLRATPRPPSESSEQDSGDAGPWMPPWA